MTLHLLAPAKLNLTLEVIRKREDGYHDIASIMQTIDLADRITVSEAPDLQLVVTGPEAQGAPEDRELNLAYRAAMALQEAARVPNLGARIVLEKRIPAGAGLGGGSSDAAAVLRALDRLWHLDLGAPRLEAVAASLGSDVPFFLYGGSQKAYGRGERIAHLPEPQPEHDFVLFTSDLRAQDKTRRMYAALRPSDFTDGERTGETYTALNHNEIADIGFFNAFDRAVAEVFPVAGAAMALCREAGLHVVVAGAGPSFFSPTCLSRIHPSLLSALTSGYGVTARACRSLSSAAALAVRET